jgi:hypothetical protein
MKKLILCFLLLPVSITAQQSIRSGGGEVTVNRVGQITIKARSDKTIEVKSPVVYQVTSYTGTSSFQPFGIDLNLGAAAGGTTGKFLAPMMGNIFGTNLSKAGNYIGGGIFHYNIAGTNATTYPSGAVLGGIGDGTTSAKGAFIAYIDGDSAQTNAGAAFKVMHNNSTAASKFTYGLDLYDAARDGYNAVSFATADIRFNSQATLSLLSATASLDFAAWSGDDCQTLTLTVTGAADGNPVTVGIPNALASVADVVWSEPWVSAANTVSVRGCKLTAGASADPAAVVVRATVLRP